VITTTDNYFADLQTAITAGLFTASGKRPKKAELYEAIAAHNTAIADDEPVIVQESTPPAPDYAIPAASADIIALEAAGDEEAVQSARQWMSPMMLPLLKLSPSPNHPAAEPQSKILLTYSKFLNRCRQMGKSKPLQI
jgi:hypothetical protein